ncbi:serine hydrolase [Sphingomonas sp.]|uniref:serine hydrolase n=1 Tax=Sphingomonas sp. TaxID=28214 RepID=UPI003B3BC027
MDAYLKAAVAHDQFTGVALVARDGVPVFHAAYGMASRELAVPNTQQTVFHIASITKQFTAMAILQLRERGKLKVEDSICTYLADCPPAWRTITIRNLLTHSSGVPNVSSLPDWDEALSLKQGRRAEFVDLFRTLPLEFAPGEKYAYSNSGYFLLGLIVERASGMAFDRYLTAQIFAPLGMNQSGYDDNRAVIPGAATGYYSRGTTFITATYIDPSTRLGDTGIVSTTGDLLKWDQALYGDKLVSRRSLDEMFTPYRGGYGYGWEVGSRFGRRTMAHSGSDGGFSSYILRFPDERTTVIILGNGDRMSAAKAAINLAAIQFGAPYKLPAPQLRDALWDVVMRNGVVPAMARFDRAREQAATDATGDMLLEVGYDLIDARRLEEADAIFRAALQRFPDLTYALDGLADSAAARGDRAAAIGFFEQSLKRDPANDYAIKGLAKLRGAGKAAS